MSHKEYYNFARRICKTLGGRPCGAALCRAVKYDFGDLGEAPVLFEHQEIRVSQMDVVQCATADVGDDLRPLLVNPTRDIACGDWDRGVSGYEEGLAYRSTLSMSLTDELYPIRDACVYSPVVQVFRGADYTTVKSFPVSVISLVAMPRADFSVENDRTRMHNSLSAVFRVAARHGNTSVIFNAFGVKDDNNPADIAQLMGNVITENAHAVRRVTVTCDGDTYLTFRRYLKIENVSS